MTTSDISWSETLIAAGMEPELAKAFDLIELRTPDARAVTELTVALLNVRSDVEWLKSELGSALAQLTKLEEAESALVHLLGEQIVELRKMQYHFDSRFDDLASRVDALNGVVGGNRKAIDRLDASLEVLHAKVRAVDVKLQEVDGRVTKVQADVTKVQADVTKVQAGVTKVQAGVTEVQADVTELRSDMTEVLAWVRTQRDSG